MNGLYGREGDFGSTNGFTHNFASSSTGSYPPQIQQHMPYANVPMEPQFYLQQNWNNQQRAPVQQQGQSWPNYAPNGMPPVGVQMGFNMLPRQVINDAFTLSVPVKPEDEPIIIEALLRSYRRNESYKDALNSLHGRNSHSASLWKDYYLDHKHRIDQMVSPQLQFQNNNPIIHDQRPKTVKKPSPNSFKIESSPSPPVKKQRRTPKLKQESPPTSLVMGRRKTLNSLTTPAPVFDRSLPPPNAEIQVPPPPSRSPTPPTRIVPLGGGRGNRYTKEDRDFFLKFISWRLKSDPTLTRNQLCELLAEKAPHHSSSSWGSFWSNNHDLPDKILAAARGEEPEYSSLSEAESSDEEEKEDRRTVHRQRKHKESSSEDDQESQNDSQNDDEDIEDIEVPAFDESAMGAKGEPFTNADLAIVARYMTSFRDFREAPFQDKWVPFGAKYPQRSAKAWAEYYRRNELRLHKLAEKIKANGLASSEQRRTKRKFEE